MKLSVIIPAYNAENYIQQAITSVLEQPFENLEVIVVLDSPTDNTKEKVNSIATTDKRIKVLENETNLGAGMSRRKGIAEAQGEYIMLLDADDYYSNDFIPSLIKKAEETDADIVSGGITTIHQDGYKVAESQPDAIFEGNDCILKYWIENRIMWMCNKIIRKKLYDLVPYSHRRYIEDTPVIIPQLWYANKVAVIDNTGYYHRLIPTSICHTVNKLDDVIYRTLCWCDLVDFFLKHDVAILQKTNMLTQVTNNIEWINELNPTEEEIKPYEHDYCEMMIKLMKLIKITGINFKF